MAQEPVLGLDFLPLGGLDDAWAAEALRHFSRHLGIPCHLRPGPRGLRAPGLANRPQGDAEILLRTLESGDRHPERLLLAVTDQDLALPIFTFVFGLARDRGQVALVSLARLDPAFYGLPPSEELIHARLLAESLHELGHLAGLQHCSQPSCLMRFAGTVEAADVRGMGFCDPCNRRLPAWLRQSA